MLELADGSRETARSVLLATGMDYRYPELDGIAERWGRSVFHCPFCHGWEVRDRPLGVLDPGPTGVHRVAAAARLERRRDAAHQRAVRAADAEDADRLRAAGVEIDERPVAGLRGPGSALTAVTFADGAERRCEGLLVPVAMHQRSQLAAQLGATLAEPGPVRADAVAVNAAVPDRRAGLSAAGDATAQMPSVATAVYTGSAAAAGIVGGLMVT